jgi:hypothetical protein
MRLRIALAKFQTPPILRSAFNNFVLEDVKHFRFGQRFLPSTTAKSFQSGAGDATRRACSIQRCRAAGLPARRIVRKPRTSLRISAKPGVELYLPAIDTNQKTANKRERRLVESVMERVP